MAENNNEQQRRLDDLLNIFIRYSDAFNNALDKNIFVINDINNEFKDAIKNFPTEDIKKLSDIINGYSNELDIATENEIRNRENREKAEADFEAKQEAARERRLTSINSLKDDLDNLNEEISVLTDLYNTANDDEKAIIEERIRQNTDRQNAIKAELSAYEQGTEARFKEAENIKKAAEERRQQEEKETEERHKQAEDAIKKRESIITEQITKAITAISRLFQNSIKNITNDYEKNASTLSAALNTNVNYISQLQHDMADNLRSSSLNAAISNMAVMSEANKLVSAGYTNIENLKSSAEALAIGREIAPGLDFDSNTVRNLTNVFGNDFITKFSAIQAAVQSTAGSTIELSSTVNSLLTNMEPVFRNAELQDTAMQGMGNVAATISSAIESNVISQSEAEEFKRMIVELMDPSKAMTSSNTAVRSAMAYYDYGSADPYQALQALIQARQQMYGGIGMSMSAEDITARSLAAKYFGDTSTFSAAYNPNYLMGLPLVEAEDLSTTYQEQRSKLQEGEYTTQRERETNWLSNSQMTQWFSDVSKQFPTSWDTFSSALFEGLNILPNAIGKSVAKELAKFDLFERGIGKIGDVLNGKGGTSAIASTIGKVFGGSGKGGTPLGGGIPISTTMTKLLGVGMMAGSAINLASQWDKEDTWTQNLGFQGNKRAAAANYAMFGAGVGMLFSPIGAAIGGLVGAISGLAIAGFAQKQAQEENTKALEAQTTATKETLGYGVTAISKLEANREIARGGGIVHLSSGDYKLDLSSYANGSYASGLGEVPYDNYIAVLHKGESVVTAPTAKTLREFNPNFWNSVDNNNKIDTKTIEYIRQQEKENKQQDKQNIQQQDNVVSAIKEQTESIVGAVRGDVSYSPLTKSAPKQYTISNNFA